MVSDVSIVKQLEKLSRLLEIQNKRIDKISGSLDKFLLTEQSHQRRAKGEQYTEQTEQLLTSQNLNRVRGKHRELLSLLINNGFHTYLQIAKKMNISQSRARAYVAELKKNFGVPLKQVRDPEGYKVGIDVAFVEQILSLK